MSVDARPNAGPSRAQRPRGSRRGDGQDTGESLAGRSPLECCHHAEKTITVYRHTPALHTKRYQ